VFEPSIVAIFGERNPLDALEDYAALDEYTLLHHAALWARGDLVADSPAPGSGRVTPRTGELWRGILLRRPTWRAVRELRRDSRAGAAPELLEQELRAGAPDVTDGRLRVDLAQTDGRPENPLVARDQLVIARRDGSLDAEGIGELLHRLPAVVVVGRAYERVAGR
jgi:hypothetical protein